MTWEQGTFLVSIAVLVLQGFSIYTSVQVKLWALEKFVTKSDFLDTLQMWTKAEGKRDV